MAPTRPRRRSGYPARVLSDDPADVVRKVEARAALMDVLTQDPRVRGAWLAWTQTASVQSLLVSILSGDTPRIRVGGPDHSGLSDAGLQLLAAIPGAPAPAWLPLWLGQIALRWALSSITGVVAPWEFRLGRSWDTRTSRATKRDRQTARTTIRRDVQWYYRAELQAPPDSLRQIARDYATSDPAYARADARSLVRDGIARAKRALEIM